jgi:hypothetical protein
LVLAVLFAVALHFVQWIGRDQLWKKLSIAFRAMEMTPETDKSPENRNLIAHFAMETL